jgi:hypothetical protein
MIFVRLDILVENACGVTDIERFAGPKPVTASGAMLGSTGSGKLALADAWWESRCRPSEAQNRQAPGRMTATVQPPSLTSQ